MGPASSRVLVVRMRPEMDGIRVYVSRKYPRLLLPLQEALKISKWVWLGILSNSPLPESWGV